MLTTATQTENGRRYHLPLRPCCVHGDVTGNITDKANVLDPSRTQTFGYDALDRLIGAQGLYGNIAYRYDALGNSLTHTESTQASTYDYDPQSNRLTAITDNTGATPYTYDANGNPLTIGSDTYAYNPDNRLLQYQGTTTASYVYNSQGQRTRKTTSQGSTQYVYDTQGHLIAEYGPNNNHKEYVYLNDEPLALIEDNNFYYIHNDHLATPQQITDQAQTVVWAADYRPFGDATTTVNTVNNNLRFPGQYYDEESGLHYNYFRYYDPKIGRYITHDPFGIIPGLTKDPSLHLPRKIRRRLAGMDTTDFLRSGLNHPYLYVKANPLSIIDPFGLAPDCSYYDTRCNEDGTGNWPDYYCDFAPAACSSDIWPDNEWTDCSRKCLQRKDSQCDPTPGQCSAEGIDTSCNTRIHFECWIECL